MIINGFGFSGYRSFGDELTKIYPLKKINLVIGQNNSGKSNIIRFLKNHYKELLSVVKGNVKSSTKTLSFAEIDTHISPDPVKTRIAFPLDTKTEDYENYKSSKCPNQNKDTLIARQFSESFDRLVKSEHLMDENGVAWIIYESGQPIGQYELCLDFDNLKSMLDNNEWHRFWSLLSKGGGGSLDIQIINSMKKLSWTPNIIPDIEFIPAIRKIGDSGSTPDDYSGIGIIERIAKLQNPSYSEQQKKQKFEKINEFARSVLENESAIIEIPFERDMINIHMDGKTLPLSSLGTGVHEVIIIAAAATYLEDTMVCIEEPELHLHPILQRKLISYLKQATENQYIFTTHSAHLLNTEDASIFYVTNNGQYSECFSISSSKDKSNVCLDLGYRPSDLLQSNCIIWVEGPSDRIYIKAWIEYIDEELLEGVHYSIMFFGGKLFSHLSAEDIDSENIALNDFISLRRLNRSTCIVFDSDKAKPNKRLNNTKTRLKREFNEGPGFAWVTKGREIENYIDPDIIEECVTQTHTTAKSLQSKTEWSNLLKYNHKKSSAIKTANKVSVARYYVDNYEPDLSRLDLRKQIESLRAFILKCN